MCCYDLIVSQETGFVDAIVKKDLHTVMLLFFFFSFFDYRRTVSQIKVDYFNSEIYMNAHIYSKHNDVLGVYDIWKHT